MSNPELEGQQEELLEEAGDRPDWLLPRYASVEDQARAQVDADRKITEFSHRAKAAEEAANAMAQRLEELERRVSQPPQQGYDPNTDPYLLAETNAWEEGDYQRALQLRDIRFAQMLQAYQMGQHQQAPPAGEPQVSSDLFAAMIDREMRDRYGDEWTELRQEVGDHVAPFLPESLGYQETVDRVAFVADSIRNRKLAEQSAQLRDQQARTAQQKRLAQTAPGGGGRVAGTPSARDEKIAAFRALQAERAVISPQ